MFQHQFMGVGDNGCNTDYVHIVVGLDYNIEGDIVTPLNLNMVEKLVLDISLKQKNVTPKNVMVRLCSVNR